MVLALRYKLSSEEFHAEILAKMAEKYPKLNIQTKKAFGHFSLLKGGGMIIIPVASEFVQ